MTSDPERAVSGSDMESMDDEETHKATIKGYSQKNILAALQDRINEFSIEVCYNFS